MTLHADCTFSEISGYVRLCQEYGIKSVYLDKSVYDRVKSVIRPIVGEQMFAGIKFKRKICVES